MIRHIALASSLALALIVGMASPSHASNSVEDPTVEALTNVAKAANEDETGGLLNVLDGTASVGTDIANDVAIDAIVDNTPIIIPTRLGKPVAVGTGSQSVEILRPSKNDAGVSIVQEGVIANDAADGTTTVTAVKKDGTLQIASIIEGVDSPERFNYAISLPEGARLELTNGQPFIWNGQSNLIGAFAPAWAKDSRGVNVPTRYEVSGNILTQVVDHHATERFSYPIVADPAYRRGMIDRVKWERWANGGWEVRLTVTWLARVTQPVNPAIVYAQGLADLREHHPRSMQYKTMAQQWDCHVIGLPGTVNIDLESHRRSWDGWRAGIIPSVLQGDPARACNW